MAIRKCRRLTKETYCHDKNTSLGTTPLYTDTAFKRLAQEAFARVELRLVRSQVMLRESGLHDNAPACRDPRPRTHSGGK